MQVISRESRRRDGSSSLLLSMILIATFSDGCVYVCVCVCVCV